MRVTWPATLPEGPGPTLYTVSYTTHGGHAERPGLLPRPGHDLRPLGHRLRRHRLRLLRQGAQPGEHVRAQPGPRRSRRSASRRPGASGRSPRPAWTSRLRVRRRRPTRGARSPIASILVAGQVVWQSPVVGRAGDHPRSCSTPSNDAPTPSSCACATSSPRRVGARYSDARTVQTLRPAAQRARHPATRRSSTASRSAGPSGHQQRGRRAVRRLPGRGRRAADDAASRPPVAFSVHHARWPRPTTTSGSDDPRHLYDDKPGRPGAGSSPARTPSPATRRRRRCAIFTGAQLLATT